MKQLLYITSVSTPISTNSRQGERLLCLSKSFNGDYFCGTFGDLNTSPQQIGNFSIHQFYWSVRHPLVRLIYIVFCYLFTGLKLRFKEGKKYDCIIATDCGGPSGVCAYLLSKIYRTKLIFEINGIISDHHYVSVKLNWTSRLKIKFQKIVGSFLIRRADLIKVLFPNMPLPGKIKKSTLVHTYPDYVFLSNFNKEQPTDEKYLLSAGFPPHVKGMDILIKAFMMVKDKYPEYKLKVYSVFAHPKELFKGDTPQIEVHRAVNQNELASIMAKCSVFLLASRTEGVPCIMIEAMACKKPVIAANVGGIPHYLNDGVNGLLFEKEDICDLAKKIDYLLSHPMKAKQMGSAGFEKVMQEFSNERYLAHFQNMIESCLKASK